MLGCCCPTCPPCLQVAQLVGVVATAKAAYDDRAARLAECQERLKECDAEIAAASKEMDALEGRKTDIVVDRKKLNNKCAGWLRAVCEGNGMPAS